MGRLLVPIAQDTYLEALKTEAFIATHRFHVTLQDDTDEISAIRYFINTSKHQYVQSSAAPSLLRTKSNLMCFY